MTGDGEMGKTAIIVFEIEKRQEKHDIEVPLDITANELVHALNVAYELEIDEEDITQVFLKAENPIALLKGNKTLDELGIHHATHIIYS